MGIPVDKLALYSALGETIDVGTNNEKLLNDEFYIGVKQKRATRHEYSELLHEFMSAVKQNYGENVLIKSEDFANHNAFGLLAKYHNTHLVFNDDIQGTEAFVLPGLVSAQELTNSPLAEHTFLQLLESHRLILEVCTVLFLCIIVRLLQAGTGTAQLIALYISKQGLIVNSRKDSLQETMGS